VVKDPPKPVVPAKSKVLIESTPPGADVFNGSERLGTTPATLTFAPDTAPFDVVVRKKGFKDGKLHVTPDHDREYVVELPASGSSSHHERPTAKPVVATPEVKPEPKPEPKPAGKLRDLKDPFAN
jgi:hypothetical protein